MLPDDPRHGTEAGYGQHRRDGEPACDPCYQGRLRADRRRRKLRTLGRSRRQVVGNRLYATIATLSGEHSQSQVARWANVQPCIIHRIMRQGPTALVDAGNKLKLLTLVVAPEVTPIGYTRRMRALMCLGYSAPRIAAEAGLNKETVKDCLKRPPLVVKHESRRKMAAAYDRLSLKLPVARDRFESAQITRARDTARKNGWPPPLAWDDIDDPRENPTGWQYVAEDRAEILRDLDARLANATEACRLLKINRAALQKWCANNGMSDIYRRLAGREAIAENQWMQEGAA